MRAPTNVEFGPGLLSRVWLYRPCSEISSAEASVEGPRNTMLSTVTRRLSMQADRLIRNRRGSKEKLAGCASNGAACRCHLTVRGQSRRLVCGQRQSLPVPVWVLAKAAVEVAAEGARIAELTCAEIDGEVARLRAENDRLRQLLEKGDGAPWTSVLFLELERESYEQQRILCLKRELCMALQRRRRLEQAVRAGHASLERALYGALSQEGASLQTLEQAFVDGTAAAESDLAEEAMLLDADAAPKQPGRRAASPAHTPSSASAAGPAKATSSRRLWEAAEIYQLEQAVFQAASSLMAFAEASGEAWADQLAARLQTLSWQLLRARELPVTSADVDASTAAVRRRLWRFMAGRPLAKCRDQPSEGVLPGPDMVATPVRLPLCLLRALQDMVEVASGEKELRTEVEQAVASMLELADLGDLWDRIIVRCTPSHPVAKVARPAAALAPAGLRFHCQVPCGIFTDELRVQAMMEDASTIRKAVVQAQELHKAGGLQDVHQMVRWITTKEDHAQKIMTTTADYFLAQKVKKADLSEDDYLKRLALHHDVMVAAMKAKQSSELGPVDTLDKAIEALAPIYKK
ncbi:hypothetical protein AK812_SmicGene37089 [Symbiodinium microadriaticum]|uniref:Uncharacterized protein n=1 Tax=Symbiodinium microadriaticum TaxID=2951 RepID=A0A1Q9CH75_SYMMI|nr:hypothetical protein AK812_SmicGene37089 [Symbiodinium microadriaticum]